MAPGQKFADLHIHSTASDGKLSPSEIVDLAKEKGLSCIALSDHDSVGGIDEALVAGLSAGIEVIPAVELSTLYGGGEVHILGYFIDWQAQELTDQLAEILDARERRARMIVEKLRFLDLDIEWEELCERAGSSYIGRPHIASLLLDKGYISKVEEAFTDRLIGNGGRAYVERHEMEPEEAINLIRGNSGVAILAHPGFYKKNAGLREEDIRQFMSEGLQGIEVYHTKHKLSDTEFYMQLAQKYQLKVTGGSDCHGGNTGEVLMGQIRLDYGHVRNLNEVHIISTEQ